MKLQKYFPFLLFVFAILLYINTLSNGYVLDDFSLIKENFVVKEGVDGISTLFKTHYRYGYGFQNGSLYRPIALSIFAIQWELFPDQPWFAHMVNVLLFGFTMMVLYRLLLKWTTTAIALITTLLFTAHPIHTEVVANIKSLDEILAFLFLILMLFTADAYHHSSKRLHLFQSLLLFFLALLTKESAITFIAIVPLSFYFFRGTSAKKSLQKVLPYLLVLIPYFTIRFNVLGSFTSKAPVTVIDNMLQGIESASNVFATKVYLLGLYCYQLIIPLSLSSDYSIQAIEVVTLSNPLFIVSLLLMVGLLIVATVQLKKKSILGFALVFAVITFSISSNLLFTIGTHFGERLLFIPSLGFCLLVSIFTQKLIAKKKLKPIGIGVLSILLAGYSYKTISRNTDWKSDLSLYSADLKKNPNSARLNYSLGLEVMKEKAVTAQNVQDQQRFYKEAEDLLLKAVELYPSYSDAYANLGLLKYRTKEFPSAEKYYLKAIELNPSNAIALSNLGAIYFEMKQYEAAKNVYQRALKANPNMADANTNMGATLATLGQLKAAIPYFEKAAELDPSNPQIYYFLGITHKNLGNTSLSNTYLAKYNELK